MSETVTPLEYSVGECVVYKSNGICLIKDVQQRKFAGTVRDYYVLEAVFDRHSTWYVPTDSAELVSSMDHLLSVDEIDTLIDRVEREEDDPWDDDYRRRTEAFGAIIKGGDRAKILALLKSLSLRKEEAEKNRRKLYVSDERILHSAEKMITEEFSYVLGIRRDEVASYIISRVGAPDGV